MRKMIVCLLIVIILSASLPVAAQVTARKTLVSNDSEREYMVYLPEEVDNARTYGLLVMLHGANMTPHSMYQALYLKTGSVDANYIMVYPRGNNRRWNVTEASNRDDDVQFIRDLIMQIKTDYPIDDSRIVLAGYSNGGMMALTTACYLSDELAAVLAIGSNYATSMLPGCAGTTPLPTLFAIGSADSSFPINGRGQILSMEEALTFVAGNYQCSENAETGDIATEDSNHVVMRLVVNECTGRGSLMLYLIIEAGHYPLPDIDVMLDGNDETGDLSDLLWQYIVAQQLETPDEDD